MTLSQSLFHILVTWCHFKHNPLTYILSTFIEFYPRATLTHSTHGKECSKYYLLIITCDSVKAMLTNMITGIHY